MSLKAFCLQSPGAEHPLCKEKQIPQVPKEVFPQYKQALVIIYQVTFLQVYYELILPFALNMV